jgi:hypothetical protein
MINDISAELDGILEQMTKPQVEYLVEQTLIEVEIARIRITRVSVEIQNRSTVFGKDDGCEVREMDKALEELCGKLRPEYPRWKFLGDFLGSCPRQAKPCLAAINAKIAILQLIKKKIEEGLIG